MMPDAMNATAPRAVAIKPGGEAPRIVAPQWNGQAGVTKSDLSATKTTSFIVTVSNGAVTVKKAHPPR